MSRDARETAGALVQVTSVVPSACRLSGDSLLVPTHFYMVVTSCQEVNRSVEDCGGPLRVFSFLIPHRPDNSEACDVSVVH